MYEKLPEQLKKDGRFCLWKYEERNGRMTKVPYQTNGRRCRVENGLLYRIQSLRHGSPHCM